MVDPSEASSSGTKLNDGQGVEKAADVKENVKSVENLKLKSVSKHSDQNKSVKNDHRQPKQF